MCVYFHERWLKIDFFKIKTEFGDLISNCLKMMCSMAWEVADKDFSDLPVEVIANVLQYLPYSDLQMARLSCRRWHMASLSPDCLERDRLVIKQKHGNVQPTEILQSERNFLHLCFEGNSSGTCESKWWFPENEVWSKLGPKLKSLSISEVTIDPGKLFGVLKLCTNLKSLYLYSCRVKLSLPLECLDDNYYVSTMPLMPKLEVFSFHQFCVTEPYCTQEDYILFQGFLSAFSTLKRLSVDCYWITDELAEKFYGAVVSYLHTGAGSLKELDFIMGLRGDGSAEDSSPDRLLSVPNLRLRKLDVNLSKTLKVLSHQQEWIEDLSFAINEGSDTEALDIIPSQFHRLKHLTVFFADASPLEAVSFIKEFKSFRNLVSLEINRHGDALGKITELQLLPGLCSEVNQTLKNLTFSTIDLSEKCLSEICRTHPALTGLSICYCNGVSDISIQSVFYYLVSLKSLELADCRELTDEGMMGVNNWCSAEVERNGYCFPVGYGIARLTNLQTLYLQQCCLTGELFKYGPTLPQLRTFTLTAYEAPHVTLESVVRLVENHPTIERLHVDSGSDKLAHAIVKNLKRPKYIRIGEYYGKAEVSEMLKQLCRCKIFSVKDF